MTGFTLGDLERNLAARAQASPAESYTARLMADPQRAAKKLGEEAVEAVIAGATGDRAALVSESADVLYHLMALLLARGVAFDEVLAELEARTGRSGLAEKAARTAEGVRAAPEGGRP
ncbi:phosphoribosyl-ATP diphosphatase [Salinarimonas rosea]|uniref:phosphoribosyl-ATP diphosphatase n=1 Tax=Salinarimonas rosea TaxID=552063 RepID=UPI00040DC6C4|nr:phosphoribosyl-ATP diphosphatase [Salinarimonas rosea]